MDFVLDKGALEDIKATIELYLNNKCKYLSSTFKDNEGNFHELVLEAGPDYSEDNKVNTPCRVTLKLVQPINDKEIEQQYQDDIQDLKEPKRYEE